MTDQLTLSFSGTQNDALEESPKQAPRMYVERWHIQLVREESGKYSKLQSSTEVADHFRFLIKEPVEVFCVAFLNTRSQVVAVQELCRGSINATWIDPVCVFQAAILSNTKRIIVVHNHPGGDPTPSDQDQALTRRLKEGADILGITLLDHIIIGTLEESYSFEHQGIL